MLFSNYAKELSPYITSETQESSYFDELIGHFISDSVIETCPILNRKSDTKYRYIKGNRTIQPKDAKFLFEHRDVDKYIDWINIKVDEHDSLDSVILWLKTNGIDSDDPGEGCLRLFENILVKIIQNNSIEQPTLRPTLDLELIAEIQEKIKSLPRPTEVPIPEEATDYEQTYISELYRAYGDAECLDTFSADDLSSYPEYEDDLDDRRVDFYAAETIRRGVMELGNGGLSSQFDVLKTETYDGVKDTAKRKHENGYECMLSVMAQAVSVPVTTYILGESPYWISARIKKGVCHHLVNDGKLYWVRRKK